jgi:hypothetical protein
MIDQYKPAEFLRHICHAEIKKPEIRNIPEIRRKSGSQRCKSTKSETHTQTMRKSNQMQLCKGRGDHKNHGVSKRGTFLELLLQTSTVRILLFVVLGTRLVLLLQNQKNERLQPFSA